MKMGPRVQSIKFEQVHVMEAVAVPQVNKF